MLQTDGKQAGGFSFRPLRIVTQKNFGITYTHNTYRQSIFIPTASEKFVHGIIYPSHRGGVHPLKLFWHPNTIPQWRC